MLTDSLSAGVGAPAIMATWRAVCGYVSWVLEWLRDDIVQRGRLPLLCCLLAFMLTFLITRTTVRFVRRQNAQGAEPRWWQPRNIHVGTKHIHHVVFGVILVMVSGVALVALSNHGRDFQFVVAATLFGIGAALVLDEYALILHLADVYWEEDGRSSVDAVFAATAVTGLLVLGFHPLTFLLAIWHDTHSWLIRDAAIAGVFATLPLAVVVILKGKVWTGLLGMFFFPLLMVGAIRSSRPHAPWARFRYTDRPERMQRALARERTLRRPVVQAKLWLQDAIAGSPHLPDDLAVDAELDREVHAAPPPTGPIKLSTLRLPEGYPY